MITLSLVVLFSRVSAMLWLNAALLGTDRDKNILKILEIKTCINHIKSC